MFQQDILDVKDIFKDLAGMIVEQGEMIGNISYFIVYHCNDSKYNHLRSFYLNCINQWRPPMLTELRYLLFLRLILFVAKCLIAMNYNADNNRSPWHLDMAEENINTVQEEIEIAVAELHEAEDDMVCTPTTCLKI